MNFIDAMKSYTRTENGALAYNTTCSKVYDMFAFGGAYRNRTDDEVITLFIEAFEENALLALKCLFYIRDITQGQGERRFTHVCLKWLGDNYPDVIKTNIEMIPEFGRWDDLYSLMNTKCEKAAFAFIKEQLMLDLDSTTPSLMAKWLKSENASSKETKKLATKTRIALGLTPRAYRKMLSMLRERIKVLERLMSANRWDEIEFDKIPSKAGFIYRNAFARRDIIKEKYHRFAMNEGINVNAKALYPYEIIKHCDAITMDSEPDKVQIAMLNKYWNSLPDYTNGNAESVMVLADTSGSMWHTCCSVRPIDVSISLALYFSERVKGAFKDSFITFESNPRFFNIAQGDIVKRVRQLTIDVPWGGSTNLVGAFDLMLDTAIKNSVDKDSMPKTLIVVSDMEIDEATNADWWRNREEFNAVTELEKVRDEWRIHGYEFPKIIYWDVNARNNIILDRNDGVTCVSGCSPVIFESVLSGKTGYELMLEKLNSERYNRVHI